MVATLLRNVFYAIRHIWISSDHSPTGHFLWAHSHEGSMAYFRFTGSILTVHDSQPLYCLLFFVQGWFSPGQVFVLDEYCARNGVRGCHRHLCYLGDLLERADAGNMIDPTLLHYSFAFCASHVHGNRYTCHFLSMPGRPHTGLRGQDYGVVEG